MAAQTRAAPATEAKMTRLRGLGDQCDDSERHGKLFHDVLLLCF
jgi:hypothetical protein